MLGPEYLYLPTIYVFKSNLQVMELGNGTLQMTTICIFICKEVDLYQTDLLALPSLQNFENLIVAYTT